MEEKKTWWERKGWIAVGGGVILVLIFSALGEQGNTTTIPVTTNTGVAPSVSSTTAVVAAEQAPAPQKSAPQVSPPPAQENAPQASNSVTQGPPRDADGEIHQLEITASGGFRNVAFSSGENYTNCNDELTVITVDGNQQPVFTTYRDNYGSINLFAGDQHSVAYGSLTNDSGNTLAADIVAGMYGSNTAGNWGLTCDQGQYSVTVDNIK